MLITISLSIHLVRVAPEGPGGVADLAPRRAFAQRYSYVTFRAPPARLYVVLVRVT
jgi:hypothetical protein